MRCLCWTLASAAVVMTLSAGCANRSDAPRGTPGLASTATPRTVTPDTAGGSPSQQAAAKMTEEDYKAIMKKVGPTYASMRKNLTGEISEAAKEAQQLVELFGEAEKFWAQHNKQDAVKWAQTARTYATQIAGDVEGVEGYRRLDGRIQRGIQLRLKRARTAATNMGGMCKQCHGTYREGNADTGYRIKPGTLAR